MMVMNRYPVFRISIFALQLNWLYCGIMNFSFVLSGDIAMEKVKVSRYVSGKR